MITKKTISTSILFLSLMTVATQSSADIITYDLTHTTGTSCGNAGFAGGTTALGATGGTSECAKYFHIAPNDPLKFVVDDALETGHLIGNVRFGNGRIATLDMVFTGFLETTLNTDYMYGQGSGGAYDPATDSPDIDFFTDASGTFTTQGRVFEVNSDNPFGMNKAFQYGAGASAYNQRDGLAAWINLIEPANNNAASKIDLNINFTGSTTEVVDPVDPVDPVDVPEPGVLGLFSLTLFGLFIQRRRKVKHS